VNNNKENLFTAWHKDGGKALSHRGGESADEIYRRSTRRMQNGERRTEKARQQTIKLKTGISQAATTTSPLS